MIAREKLSLHDHTKLVSGKNSSISGMKQYRDIPAILLLFIILSIISHRMEITNWTDTLYLIGDMVLFGFISGVFLGLAPLHSLLANILGLIFAVFIIPWQLGNVVEAGSNLNESYYLLQTRLYPLILDFLSDRPVEDTLLFLTVTGLIYYSMSFFAGYGLIRKGNPWLPILVLGYSFLITNHYDPNQEFRNLYTILLILFTLLLWGRLHYLHKRELWRQRGVRLEYDTGYSHTRATLIVTILFLITAWNMPFVYRLFSTNSPFQFYLIQGWENIREKFSNAVVGLNYSGESGSDVYREGLSLGSRAATNTQPVFSVNVLTPVVGKARYFWYGFSYDTFENDRWVNKFDTKAMTHPVDWPFGVPEWKRRYKAAFDISVNSPLLFTFYSPIPIIYLNRPGEIVLDSRFLQKLEIVAVLASPALQQGDHYQAVSLVSAPTVTELRTSGNTYPQDILERYLNLPVDFSQRIKDKAVEITAQETNAYDRVSAITEYLRTTIEYSDRMPLPPPGRDLLEWVLFDYKKGFCDYYASLEVLMLRSIGIPARFSVGYSQGTLQSEGNSYLVLKKDSHAWPEVYFPEFGWIEFEPTVSQPPLFLPAAANQAGELPDESLKPGERSSEYSPEEELQRAQNEDQPVEIPRPQITAYLPLLISLITIVIVGMVYGISQLAKKLPDHPAIYLKRLLEQLHLPVPGWLNDLALKSQFSTVEKYYLYLIRMSKRLRIPARPGWTPAERISSLANQYPPVTESARILLNEYQKKVYGGGEEDASQTYPAYVEVRDYLNDAWLRQKFRFFK